MTLPSSIRQTDLTSGYPVLDIQHPTCTARVALNGAHLMEWTPARQMPVLYMSPQAVLKEGKAIRGGVPICWPWFGPHETDKTLPAHGFARTRFWELTEAAEDAEGVMLKFSLRENEETRRLWPQAFHLELEMRLGTEMHLSLRMENTGNTPFTISGALHTYLAVGDIQRVTVEGLDGAEYLDTVGTQEVRRQSGDITFDREVDRNYRTSDEVRLKDAALNRTLVVRGSGSHTAVVWNPWIEKSKTIKDLPEDGYKSFVCLETANAWRDHVTVAPGAQHTLATTVRVA
jgi:glucose-6-phosphate 1-epimerase